MQVAAVVREFLQILLVRKGDSDGFTDQDGLLVAGRLDSVDVMEIVVFLENTFAINFSERPFDQGDFDSVNSIVELIEDSLQPLTR